ncbi:MAG: hypothetical protein HYT22_01335 [Candidatus Niyogibacteria bacterium]|nr:hypothetical protein [Candidatus Niyogibacteria bacterium]
MTPHDFFIQNIWWMLQAIKKDRLLTPENGEFTLSETGENTPDLATQRKLLRMLRGYHAVTYEAVPDVPLGRDGKPVLFHLTLGEKFDETYKLFENGLKLGLDAKEFHNVIQHWAFPHSYNDKIVYRAWEIIKAKPKGATAPTETKLQPTDKKVSVDEPAKPYTLIEGGKGYFKFYKQREKILVGSSRSRHFKLLQTLCEPHFGVQKNIDAVFEAIRLPKDKGDSRLIDYSPQRHTRMVELIEFTKKELQKNEKLQGKIRYRTDAQKRTFWLELEG